MKTPQKDIDWALSVERNLKPEKREKYLEYLNGKPMSERKTEQEIRDGCILTGLFARYFD